MSYLRQQFIKILIPFALIAIPSLSKACSFQEKSIEEVLLIKIQDTVPKCIDVMPVFPSGQDSLIRFLSRNVKYPMLAAEMGITGRVIVQFVIDSTGKVCHVKTIKGIGGGCDEEAVRVIKLMPNWKPGMDKGKLVSVLFTMPIGFSLKEDNPKKLKQKKK